MKEVRKKFVLYAMLAVLVLLLLILTVINGTNFAMAASDADAVTSLLAENKGAFTLPQGEFPADPSADPGAQFPGQFPGQMPGQDPNSYPPEPSAVSEEPPEEPPAELPPNFAGMPFFPEGMGPMGPESPETGFSTRYFTVCFRNDEISLTAYEIAAVTQEEAVSWAKNLKTDKESTGWTRGTYRYRSYVRGDATYVTVIDQGRELTPSYRILIISLIGMALGLVVSFLFLTYISKQLFRPLEDADRKQRQFLLEAEKEFKIPLTVIQADAELLERENGPSDYTTSIHRQVNRMADLTRDLGNLALFSQNAAVVSCSLSEIFGTAIADAAPTLEMAGIRLTTEWAEGISISSNPEGLQRIADELLENISKFALGEAKLSTEKREGRIILTAANDCELPDGPCDNVFDRFIRLENAEGKPGAGLGLSFVKDAVYQIGGRVSARVKDGRFILQLYL